MRDCIVKYGKQLIICCLLVFMMFSRAIAEEAAMVRIPVLASGADCTALLYDSDGTILQTLPLKIGETNAFVVECVGLKRFTYTIRLMDQDTETVKYDHTQYHVNVDLFYGSDDQIIYSITVDELGVLGEAKEGKKETLIFENVLTIPTPVPTATPTPVPTTTPVPYDQYFTFTKVWQGDHEDSIDWIMYNSDGTVRHKRFNKKIISDTEWKYEAWFKSTEDITDCYIVETPPDGYHVRYENVGDHAGETDRCYNGGTIINYKVPKTGDDNNLRLWIGLVLLGVSAVCGTLIFSRKKNSYQ